MSKDVIISIPKVTTSVTIKAGWIEDRDKLIKDANDFPTIADQVEFELASEVLKSITKASNTLEAMRKDLTAPFKDASKVIKTAADDARNPLEDAKVKLKAALGLYSDENDKKIEEEKRQIEKAERKVAEKEAARQRKIQELEEAGIVEEVPPYVPPPLPVLPQVEEAKSSSVRIQEHLTWDLDDETLVPEEFKTFDPRKLNAWKKFNQDSVKAKLKGGSNGTDILPGITFRIKKEVMSR